MTSVLIMIGKGRGGRMRPRPQGKLRISYEAQQAKEWSRFVRQFTLMGLDLQKARMPKMIFGLLYVSGTEN
jgi:hypothetical protein